MRMPSNWSRYLSGRLFFLVFVGAAVAVIVGYLLWNQVLSVQATPDWSKLITGTELGLQIGVIIALGGVNAPITWIDRHATRKLSGYGAGYIVFSALVLSCAPFIVWVLLQLTPQTVLEAQQPGITHADFTIGFFISLLTQMWWTLGWGLLGQSLAGKYAAIPVAALSFFALIGLQAIKLLRFFPGGYQPPLPEVNLPSMTISLAILICGGITSSGTRLGANPLNAKLFHSK